MLPDLQRRFNTKYILTRRLNQDVLENFFGVIRAKGGLHDHPNALEFKYRLRSYVMGKNEGAYSEFSNVEADDTPDLPISGSMINKLDCRGDPLVRSFVHEENIDKAELHELEYDGLENLAGFLCCKLGDPNLERSNTSKFTWTDHLSEGGLHQPSEEFLSKVEHLENIFKSVNGDTIFITKNYINNLMLRSSDIECSEKAKRLFFRSRMYFRMKELNRRNTVILGKRKMLKTIT